MREMCDLALKLFIIALLAGLILGGTNLITEDRIRENEMKKSDEARYNCLPQANRFEEIIVSDVISTAEKPEASDLDRISNIQKVYKAFKDDVAMGYVFEMSVNGYKSSVALTIGAGYAEGALSGELAIAGVVSGKNDETPGLGTKALDGNRLLGYVGQSLDTAHIDAVTGATITSTAVETAIDIAGEFYNEFLSVEGGNR